MKLFINNKWRFLNLNYINKCDLITQQKNICKSIYNLPKIHKIHVYLNTWEVQKYCEEAKNKTISPEDFQIGVISLLQTIANTNIKIKNRTKEYTVTMLSKKKSKMKKLIKLESFAFKSTLQNNLDILEFLEFLYLESINTSNFDFLKTKKIKRKKIKNYYLNTLSLKIPLDSFPDLREHNRINLNEMFFLTKIKLHIDIVIKQTNKKYQYKNIYPLWLNSINNN